MWWFDIGGSLERYVVGEKFPIAVLAKVTMIGDVKNNNENFKRAKI